MSNLLEDKIPENAQIATCPKCSYKFKFRELTEPDFFKQNTDVSSDKILLEEHTETKQEEDLYSYFEKGYDDYIAWENIEKYGFWSALVDTVKKVMFNPTEFFKRLPISGNLTKALVFYLIISEIQAISQVLWSFVGLLKIEDPVKAIFGFGISGIASLLMLIFYPIFLTAILFLGSAINHLCLKILKAGKSGFGATFKVVSYSVAPMWLSIIPFLGAFVGSIWSIVITILGFSSIHNSSIGRVIVAFLLPVIVILLLIAIGVGLKGHV